MKLIDRLAAAAGMTAIEYIETKARAAKSRRELAANLGVNQITLRTFLREKGLDVRRALVVVEKEEK